MFDHELSELFPATALPPEPMIVGGQPCQTNTALSALLIQMLLALQPHLLMQHNLAAPWPAVGGNEFVPSASAIPAALQTRTSTAPVFKTTTWTSSVVSTLTETLSKVVTIWFRNERIPTTILSTATRVVTDTIVMTSTLQLVEATEGVGRERRDADRKMPILEPSFSAPDTHDGHSLPLVAHQDDHPQGLLSDLLTRPQVVEAWNAFLKVVGDNIDEDQHI